MRWRATARPSIALLLAYRLALAAVVGAMLYLLFLRQTQSDRAGLPLGLLLLTPFICMVAGIVWWVMRLLGLLD